METHIVLIGDKAYRVYDKLLRRLRSLEPDSEELARLCEEIIDGHHGRCLGFVMFDWRP